MGQHSKTSESYLQPILSMRTYGLIFTLAGIATSFIIWQIYHINQTLSLQQQKLVRAQYLISQIIYLDEVLTNSSRMAAFSGDERWRTRYDTHVPTLDQALDELALIPITRKNRDLMQKLSLVNGRLLLMEKRAYELIQDNHLLEAELLLDSPKYTTLKREFRNFMQPIQEGLESDVLDIAQTTRTYITYYALSIFLILGLALLFWLFLLRNLRNREDILLDNIKRRTHAENESSHMSRLMLQLAKHSPVALAMVDRHFNYLVASRRWCQERDLDYETLSGSNFFDSYEGNPRDRESLERIMEGFSDINEGHRVETPEGPRWWRWLNQPWFDPEGEVAGAILFMEEITTRKEAEKALAKAEEKYRLLIQHLPDYVMETDLDGTILFLNHPMPMVRPVDVGSTLQDLVPKDLAADLRATIEKVKITGSPQPLEMCLNLAGKELFFRMRIALIDSKQSNKRLLIICNDVTTEKRALTAIFHAQTVLERRVMERTAELEAVNEEVKSFAYIISHDLRAPLVNIKGFVGELRFAFDEVLSHMEQLRDKLSADKKRALDEAVQEDIPEAIAFIESSVQRMDQLITAVLTLSRMGRRELNMERVNVPEIVDQCLKNLAYRIDQEHIKVKVDSLPVVIADITAMTQIFSNIITNAVTYLQPGRKGLITIGGVREAHATRFWVKDNGRGIAEADIPKVFEIFRRVGRQDTPGEGMGMAYVKTLVARHGGKIQCSSIPGEGTTFSFTIADQNKVLQRESVDPPTHHKN